MTPDRSTTDGAAAGHAGSVPPSRHRARRVKDAHFDLQAQLEERHWWFTARREIVLQLLTPLVPPNQGHLVVDIGCGTGGLTSHLWPQYAAIGVDPSSHAIAIARERFPEGDFRVGGISEAVAGAGRAPRAVLLLDVVEHVRDDADLVRGALAMLAPGGVLVLTAPADMRIWSRHDVTLGHYRRYDLDSLRLLWKGLDADERLLSYFNHRLAPLARTVRRISGWLGRSYGTMGMDLSLRSTVVNSLLRGVFQGEAAQLVGMLEGDATNRYPSGVSLIAVLRRRGPDDLPTEAGRSDAG